MTLMFKTQETPLQSDFGKYPRSLQEAFKGVDYGCAVEVPLKRYTLFKRFLKAFPKIIWGTSLIVLISILVNI
jgi:hypothetical protein